MNGKEKEASPNMPLSHVKHKLTGATKCQAVFTYTNGRLPSESALAYTYTYSTDSFFISRLCLENQFAL